MELLQSLVLLAFSLNICAQTEKTVPNDWETQGYDHYAYVIQWR